MSVDEKSRPLRRTVESWVRDRRAGMVRAWDRYNIRWDYAISVVNGPVLIVKVAEDGSEAGVRVRGGDLRERVAKTPRGLARILNALVEEKCSDG